MTDSEQTKSVVLRPWLLLGIGVGLLAAAAGAIIFLSLHNPAKNIEKQATEALYGSARSMIEATENAIAGKNAEDIIRYVRYTYGAPAYASQLTDKGDAQWDIVYTSQRQTGGGLDYKQINLQACVRYIASATTYKVTAEPIACPQKESLQQLVPSLPANDESIMLDEARLRQ